MKSFGAYLFNPPVLAKQEKPGVAEKNARVYEDRRTGTLGDTAEAPGLVEPLFTEGQGAVERIAQIRLAERDGKIEVLSRRLRDIGHEPETAV